MIATLGNMKRCGRIGHEVFAHSPETGERCSAAPGDYWLTQDADVLTDSEGQPMVLAYEITTIIPISEEDI